MGTNSIDYVCDLDCPSGDVGKGFCCCHCDPARRKYVNDENRHLWKENEGFYSNNGCRLPREKMPPECREYDCRKCTFVIVRRWVKGRWRDIRIGELDNNGNNLISSEKGQKYCVRF